MGLEHKRIMEVSSQAIILHLLTSLTYASKVIREASALSTYNDQLILYFSTGRFDLEGHQTSFTFIYLPSKCFAIILESLGALGGLGSNGITILFKDYL